MKDNIEVIQKLEEIFREEVANLVKLYEDNIEQYYFKLDEVYKLAIILSVARELPWVVRNEQEA